MDDAIRQPQEKDVVAFDFDGTLTVHDSFIAFLAWRTPPRRLLAGLLKLTPAALRYLFDRDRGRLKAAAVARLLAGTPRAELEAEAKRFADERWSRFIRPDALAEWIRWRDSGARLVIVTASPETTVRPFAERLGADDLLATRLAFDGDARVAGPFDGLNCRADEKVRRLRERFGEGVRLKAAYGDTSGDTAMLAIAEIKGWRRFRLKP